jgi:tRNA (cmo5U34)-methyltransferase
VAIMRRIVRGGYARAMGQFHWDPDAYLQLMAEEVPDYARLQDEVALAAGAAPARRALELGTGTGETARRVLEHHAGARLTGIDASGPMLSQARLAGADLRIRRLEDPLPGGPFELVFSALAVHHLDGPGKADLFARVAAVLAPGGRFVLGDVVVPEDPADVVTPIDGVYDTPDRVADQLAWLEQAGLRAHVAWARRDLAVLVAERPIGEVGPSLPAEVLERAAALPRKPAPVTLTGSIVRLVPIDLERDVEPLHALSDGRPARWGDRHVGAYDADALIWRYMPAGPFADAGGLRRYLAAAGGAPDALCLCVRCAETDQPLGAACLMANHPEHLKIELGNIWYSPVAQGAGVNSEAARLMLAHVFGLGYRRAEWKCDALNARSRRAAERLGFTFEGIQDAHYLVKGRNRDTAWFRMLASDWTPVQ